MLLLLPELTPIILSNVERKDIYECMKACKLLYSTLSHIYYYRITLSERDHLKFFELTKQTRVDGSKIGDFVEHLHFSYQHTRLNNSNNNLFLNEAEFHQLVHNLPLLKRITFAKDSCGPYLQYLQSVPLYDLPLLREIAYPTKLADFDVRMRNKDHLQANIRFKDRITTIVSWLFEEPVHFKKLKHLAVKVVCPSKPLISIFNEYSQLKTFECGYLHDWGTQHEINRAVLKNLTLLKLTLKEKIAKQHINYLIECLPNLQELHLSGAYHSFVDTLSSLDKSTTIYFQQYLKKINRLVLRDRHVGLYPRFQDISVRDSVLLDFIQGISFQGSFCNLKVHFTYTPSLLKDYTIIEKHGQTIDITTVWLMDIFQHHHDAWTDRLNFLTFTSITFINTCPLIDTMLIHLSKAARLHNFLINPLVALLERKQQEKTACSLFIRSFDRHMLFYNIKDADQFPSRYGVLSVNHHACSTSGKGGRATINYGSVRRLLITEDLLRSLGRLYPHVEQLTLEKCTLEDKQKNKRYCVDLSGFYDIHQFTLDVDVMFRKKLRRPFYIILVNPEKSILYYFNECKHALEYLDGGFDDIPQSSIIIQISYMRMKRFRFKRGCQDVEIVENKGGNDAIFMN